VLIIAKKGAVVGVTKMSIAANYLILVDFFIIIGDNP
jgi:hypothetical protein